MESVPPSEKREPNTKWQNEWNAFVE